ncbi:MAG: DUF99 family protein [Anaerolineales bacterium]
MSQSQRRFSNIIGLDDCPFSQDFRGAVQVVGTVYAGLRLDGLLVGEVEKDGFDAADRLVELVSRSKFAEHVQLIMLQGITLAGFNVVDVFDLHERLDLPVLVVSRREPDLSAIREALLTQVSQGEEKWAVIKRLGSMEPMGAVFIQRVGLNLGEAEETISRFAVHGHIPEPLRTAHLIAGALVDGQSRGRA